MKGIGEILPVNVSNPNGEIKEAVNTFTEKLGELVSAKKVTSLAEAVRILTEGSPENQAKLFKDLGLDYGSLIKAQVEMLKQASEQMAESSKEKQALFEKLVDEKMQNRAAELGLTKELLALITGIQSQSTQQVMAMMEKLNEERFKRLEESNKPKEDPIANLLMQTAIDILKERITKPSDQDPRSKFQELLEFQKLLQEASKAFAPVSTNNPISMKLEEMKIDVEREKIRLQHELEREERQERLKLEERRTERLASVFEKIAEIAGAVLPQFLNRSQGLSHSAALSAICPNCGENVDPSKPQCLRCGLPLRPPIQPTLEQRPVSQVGGGLDI